MSAPFRAMARTSIATGFFAAAAGLAFLASAAEKTGVAPKPVRYDRDVRAILSDRCFRCHGPDAGKRQAELRLDLAEIATAVRDGHAAVVLIRWITGPYFEHVDPAPVGEHQAHGEARHLGVVPARRTVQAAQREVARDHAGLGPVALL